MLLMTACSDHSSYLNEKWNPSLEGRYLSVNPTSVSLPAKSGKDVLKVVSLTTPWQFTGSANWLAVSPASGMDDANVDVTAQDNLSGDESRSCILAFKSTASDYGYTKDVSVTQTYATPYIEPAQSSLTFDGKASVQTIAVESNIKWEATCSQSWVSVDVAANNSSITISVAENTAGSSRTAYIVLKGAITKAISITQSVAKVSPSSTTTLNYDNIGGSKSFTFTSEASWSVTTSSSWITVNPSSGSAGSATLTITVPVINSASTRSGNVYVKIGTTTMLTIPVQQGGNYITPAVSTVNISGASGTQKVKVNANVTWNASSNVDWMTVKKEDDGVAISVTENLTNAKRTGKVTLSGGGITSTISVSQVAAGMDIEGGNVLQYENTGGTYAISLTSETAWKAETSEDWIEVTPESGEAGKSQLQISVSPNGYVESRTGFVYLKIGDKSLIEITVKQRGLYIEIGSETLTFDSTVETKQMEVSSNTSWEVLSCPQWLEVTPTSGSGNKTISITSKDNPLTDARTGQLIIGQKGVALSDTLNVTQEGKSFDDVVASMSFSDKAESKTLNLSTDGHWTVSAAGYDWINVSPLSGDGNANLTVSVTENRGDEKRTGKIDITVGTTSKSVVIEQDGKYFTVNPTSLPTIPSTGGAHKVSIVTNERWVATSHSSWITLTPNSGQGDATVEIKAGDNPSINMRKDTTVITPTNLQAIKVVTVQAARYLRVNVNGISFFAKGGMSDLITVETDGTFEISTENDWLTINQDGKTFMVTAQNYEGNTKREGVVDVKLMGLAEGESYKITIPVTQLAKGASFVVNPVPDDQDWNLAGNTYATVTIVGFGQDENWNTAGNTGATVTIVGFDNDENWNN